MILTTPLLSELRRYYPESEIYVLASKKNSVITRKFSAVNYTYEYDKKFLNTLKLLFRLRKKRIDLWIDTKDEYSSTSKILKKLSKPLKSIGFNIKEKVFDTDLNEYVKGKHRVEINLSPLNSLGKNVEIVKPMIEIPKTDSDNVLTRLEKTGNKRVLLNLSAGLITRDLANEKWLKIANGIMSDYSVILTGQEKDYTNINTVIKSINRNDVHFIETNTIFELAELIKQCSLVVTPDTSAVHIASCFNTPIVCFFHNVEWVRIKFAPLSEKQRIIVSKEENSFESITPEEITESINELLA